MKAKPSIFALFQNNKNPKEKIVLGPSFEGEMANERHQREREINTWVMRRYEK